MDALNKPHPFLKLILMPSRVIFSPSRSQFLIKSSIILNLFSSVTFIFNSGVENKLGSFLTNAEILSLFFEISSIPSRNRQSQNHPRNSGRLKSAKVSVDRSH